MARVVYQHSEMSGDLGKEKSATDASVAPIHELGCGKNLSLGRSLELSNEVQLFISIRQGLDLRC